MKTLYAYFSKIQSTLFTIALVLSTATFAKNIDMYDQPNANAKKIGTIDVANGVMPIYTPKGNTSWVKVADPHNGNVGWVKAAELSNGSPTTFSFTQQIIDGNKDQQKYQVFEFGNMSDKNKKQNQQMLQQMQSQQLINQKSVQQSIQKIVNDINSIYQQQSKSLNNNSYPIIMPIVIFPSQKDMQQDTSKK